MSKSSEARTGIVYLRCLDAPWEEEGLLFEVDFARHALAVAGQQRPAHSGIGQGGSGDEAVPVPAAAGEGSEARQPATPRPDSPYLTVQEAALYCRLAVGTIYNHRREIQRMPGTGKLLFKREDLDAWLQARRRKR